MRRNFIISLLFTIGFYSNGFSQPFGLPQWLDVATWSLTYPSGNSCNADPLPYSLNHRDAFVNTLQSLCSSHNPYISSSHPYDFVNPSATLASFQSSQKDICEIVYFVGHGATNTHHLLFLDNTTCDYSSNFNFGGNYTKWAFLEACTALYSQNPPDYLPWFNGVHAVFGFRSKYWQWNWKSDAWQCAWYGCDYTHSWDTWTWFWQNWFSGQQMWTAYSNAIIRNVNHANTGYFHGPNCGEEFAVVAVFGHAYDNNGNWQYVCGATEVITNILRTPTPPQGGSNWYHQGLIYWSTIVGTPSYN
jgi:hypothetical protein